MYTQRRVTDTAGLRTAQQLCARLWQQQAPYAYWLPGDMAWWRAATPDDSALQTLVLWYAGSVPVGATWTMDDAVDIIADTSVTGLFDAMLTQLAADPTITTAHAFSRDVGRHAVLRRHGFQPHQPAFRVHLMDPRDAPRIPLTPGWHVSPLPPGDAATSARAAAQRSAFQSTKMTQERYAWARTQPGYTPEWDTVLTTPTGDIAAFVTVWYDHYTNTALCEPVGCVHAYQRQGLTRMLFSTLLQRLAAAGVRTVSVLSLPVSAEKPAGRFYESCGFQPIDEIHAWRRVENSA